jgi:TPR repeat protein
MIEAPKSSKFVWIAVLLGTMITAASAQAPQVKTTYGVAPAKETLWAVLHDPLSDEDIAKVNLDLLKKGNKEAAWELGLAYMQGLGVPQDFTKAEEMFQMGAIDADEKGMVGMFYAHGYFPPNLDAVERWHSTAGRPLDFFEIGEAYKAAAQRDQTVAPRYYAKATAFYLGLLKAPEYPEARMAQLELGNFVIDGIYSAGNDAKGRARNLELARMIAQELLGQKESQIAVEYKIGQEDLPPDQAMSLRYCERAAAYDIDGAQHSYVEMLNERQAHDFTGYDAVAWTRLSSQKMSADGGLLKAMTTGMSREQIEGANAAYDRLVETRARYGAYYVQDDSLRNASPAALAAMDQDDPDVQVRQAFNLEKDAAGNKQPYQRVLAMYRKVRDRRDADARFVLGRYALRGTNGVPKNIGVAEYWLREAVRSGSKPAQELLETIEKQPSGNE